MSKWASTAGLLAGSTAMLAAAGFLAGAIAQTPAAPDFSSNQASWEQGNGVNFIPVPGSPPPIANDPAHPHYSNAEARRLGIQPTYRIADLTNPNLKPWAKEVMKKDNDEVLKGKIGYTPGSSCKPAGVPVFMLDGGPFYFVQTPKEVLIIASEDSNVRHVYMDVPHSKNPEASWYGESVGHYENGDTLVVDTIGLTTKAFVDQFRTPHTDKLHVTERWRLTAGGKTIEIEVTVDDPGTFNQPWKGMVRLQRGQLPFTEFVCSEGNHNLFDYGIPVANRPDF
jgi:hypothetical protein